MKTLAEDKAKALLVSGHVRVRHVDELGITIEVDGATGRYRTTWDVRRGWRCSCPELRGRCSHIVACRRITVATDVERNR